MNSPFAAQEELQAENEKLKEKLREKVWTMALATVARPEKTPFLSLEGSFLCFFSAEISGFAVWDVHQVSEMEKNLGGAVSHTEKVTLPNSASISHG